MLRGRRVSQHQRISVDLRPFESILQEHKGLLGGEASRVKARFYSTLKIIPLHLEDKNSLPARTPAGSSILMTEIYYSGKINLCTCVHALTPVWNICWRICVFGIIRPSGMTDDCCCTVSSGCSAAPFHPALCQLVHFS